MLQLLSAQLNDPQPEKCIEALCALVMVRETQALDRLTQMWNTEQRPEVKKVIGWAGRQLYLANQEGYTTTQTMMEAFRLTAKFTDQSAKEEEERRKLSQLRGELFKESANQKNKGVDSYDMLSGAIRGSLGGTRGVMRGALRGYKKSLDNTADMSRLDNKSLIEQLMKDNEGEPAPRPITPPRPTDTNIQVWLKKLSLPEAKVRISAITQLGDFNNPTALGAIGLVYVKDPEDSVKAVALQVGTQLYFNALYWQNPPQQP